MSSDAGSAPTFGEAFRVWLRIGLTSFGGPAGQIAMMHRILVDERKWLDERTYLLALNFCTLLPGPEAMQLATYAGWRLHGVAGGLMAGLLFVVPGAAVILALAATYAWYGSVPVVAAVFTGIKAAVLAIVLEALLRIAKRSLTHGAEWAIAASAFFAIFFLNIPFPVIVLIAGLVGYLRAPVSRDGQRGEIWLEIPIAATARTALTWLAIWLLPLAAMILALGQEHTLSRLAFFFAKLAVVTFGGAYAVLAYMAQDVVQIQGWLTPGEMLDGLGLAETTPGPLILVTEFVGFLAAFRHDSGASLGMGLAGAVVTLWATFAPSFLFVFTGAPYVERLKSAPRLKGALSAITAAVVGVILNLTVWFALHVLFRNVDEIAFGPVRLVVPDVLSLDAFAGLLACLAAALLFGARLGIVPTLAVCGVLSLAAALWQ